MRIDEILAENTEEPVEIAVYSPDNYQTRFEVEMTQGPTDIGFFAYHYYPETNEVENDHHVTDVYRGQGHGRQLLLTAIKTANQHGLPFKMDRDGLSSGGIRAYQSLLRSGDIKQLPDGNFVATQ